MHSVKPEVAATSTGAVGAALSIEAQGDERVDAQGATSGDYATSVAIAASVAVTATSVTGSAGFHACNQRMAIRFIDDVRRLLPFRIHVVQTDNGGEFQSRFHWHLEASILATSTFDPARRI